MKGKVRRFLSLFLTVLMIVSPMPSSILGSGLGVTTVTKVVAGEIETGVSDATVETAVVETTVAETTSEAEEEETTTTTAAEVSVSDSSETTAASTGAGESLSDTPLENGGAEDVPAADPADNGNEENGAGESSAADENPGSESVVTSSSAGEAASVSTEETAGTTSSSAEVETTTENQYPISQLGEAEGSGSENVPSESLTSAADNQVASIADGETEIDSVIDTETELRSALAAGGSVAIGGNISVNNAIEIPEGITVTLDLAGYTITGGWNGESQTNHIYVLTNYGSLTVLDSMAEGKIVSRGVYNYGTMILNSGTIEACDGNGGYAVNNESGSTFTMNGGTVVASYEDGDAAVAGNYDATALDVPDGCIVVINGGTIKNVSNYTYAIESYGTLAVSNSSVTVEGNHGAVAVHGGTVSIADGNFYCNGVSGQSDHVMYLSDAGKICVDGGRFYHRGCDSGAANGAAVYVDGDAAVVTINSGEFMGMDMTVSGNANTAIYGGSFTTAVTRSETDCIEEYVAEGAVITLSGSVYPPSAIQYINMENGSCTITSDSIYYITGTATNSLTVKSDATITLDNLTINAEAGSSAISIESGNVTLIVQGNVNLTGGDNGAGIYVAEGASVTIQTACTDSDCLTAVGNNGIDDASGAAGIGGTYEAGKSGTIIIDCATVIAKGYGAHASGIGSGYGSTCGSITIKNGSNVTAYGGYYAEGGLLQTSYGSGDPEGGAAIGGGAKTNAVNAPITIDGSLVKAYGGSKAAGIGAAFWASCEAITISGYSDIEAYGGSSSAGIGTSRAGSNGVYANISIINSEVTAIGGEYGSGIGGGYNGDSLSTLPKTTITIENGTVEATGVNGGAGIGGGYKTNNLDIRITGNAVVTATAGVLEDGSNKTIAQKCASAIGSGANGSGTFTGATVEVSDGTTVTVNTYRGGKAAIEGLSVIPENVEINALAYGAAFITANDGEEVAYMTIESALMAVKEGETVTVYAGSYNMGTTNFTLPANVTIVGETDENGENLVTINNSLSLNAGNVTLKNVNIVSTGDAFQISGTGIIKGCSLTGANGTRWCYANGGEVEFADCIITGSTYGVHFDGGNGEADSVTISNCVITGWTSFARTVESVSITGTTFADGAFDYVRFFQNAEMKDCAFESADMAVDVSDSVEITVTAENLVYADKSDAADVFDNRDAYFNDIYYNGEKIVIQAVITDTSEETDDVYYRTLAQALADCKNKETVTLLADIDLTDIAWTPVESFTGTFDGNGYVISNLKIEGEENAALIAKASNTVIQNITIENAKVTGTKNVGALVGSLGGSTKVINCHLDGVIEIAGNYKVGGLVGEGYARFENCSVQADSGSYVKGMYSAVDLEGDNVGGLTGFHGEGSQASFTNCSVSGLTIEGTRKVGGIVGSAFQNNVIESCTVTDTVIGTNADTAYADANAKTMGIGGIVGLYTADGSNDGSMNNCYVKNVTFTNENAVEGNTGIMTGGLRGSETPVEPVVSYGNNTFASCTGYENEYLIRYFVQVTDSEGNATNYFTVKNAVNAASADSVITLLGDVKENVSVTKKLILDLNGYTWTAPESNSAIDVLVADGNFTVRDTSEAGTGAIVSETSGWETIYVKNGTVTLESGTLTGLDYGVYVSANGTLNVNGGTIEVGDGYGIVIMNEGAAVNVNGGKVISEGYGIFGNGMEEYSGTAIHVTGGTITGTLAGIYHPQGGELKVSGGTISGGTGIYAKSGTIQVTGGTILGNGAETDYVYDPNTDGCQPTGDGIVIDCWSYPCGNATIKITNGTIKSVNANAVAVYVSKDNSGEIPEKFISGGMYSSDVSAYTATGLTCVADGTGMYTIKAALEVMKISGGVPYFYATLKAALEDAEDGDMLYLLGNVTSSEALTVDTDVTIMGQGLSITFSGHQGFVVTEDVAFTLENVTLVNNNMPHRGATHPQLIDIKAAADVTLNDVATGKGTHYVVNMRGASSGADLKINDSELYGSNVLNIWGSDHDIIIEGSELTSTSLYEYEFGAVAFNGNSSYVSNQNTLSVDAESTLTAVRSSDENYSYLVIMPESDNNGVTVVVEEGAVLNRLSEGDALVANAAARIGNVYYSSLTAALEAAKDGETIILVADITAESFTVDGKELTIDLNGHTMSVDGDNKFINDADVTIKNGTLDLDNAKAEGDAIFCVGNYSTTAALTLDGVTVTGDGYSSAYAVFYVYGTSELEITASEATLSNDQAEAGGFIKAESGADGVVNLKDSTINLTNAQIGFLDGTVTMNDVELTIKGGKNAINQSALTVINSTIVITDCDGRALTLKDGNVTVTNSTLDFSGATEGEIRFKEAVELTIDDASSITTCNVYADAVGGGLVNGQIVTGTEKNPSIVYENEVSEAVLENPAWTAAVITVDDEGTETVTGYYMTLAEAVAAAKSGSVVTILTTGTYTVPSFTNKELTIQGGTGDAADVVLDMSNEVILTGSDVTFKDLTLTFTDDSTYKGFHHVSSETYENCIINGQMFTYGDAVFTDCTFNQTSSDSYNLWTYGAETVELIDCTFNCAGKSVLLYNEGNNVTDLTVTSCEFIASSAVEGKAAIEIDTSLMQNKLPDKTSHIVIDSETTATGFASGSVSGSSLWNDKKTQTNLTVTVDDVHVWPMEVAEIGDIRYYTLQSAVDAAEVGDTICLLTNVNLREGTVKVAKDDSIILDLNGWTITGETKTTLTANHQMILNQGNLTIIDSSESGNGTISYTYSGDSTNYSCYANTISNVQGTLTIEGGRFENNTRVESQISYVIDNLTNGSLGDAVLTIKDGIFSSPNYICVRGFANSTSCTNSITIEDGTFTGRVQLHDANANANKAELKISGGTFNANSEEGDAFYIYAQGDSSELTVSVTGGDFTGNVRTVNGSGDAVNGFITGGTYSIDVTEMCAEGYEAVESEDGRFFVAKAVCFNRSMQAFLSLESEVYLNIAFRLDNLNDIDPVSIENKVGLLIWDADSLPEDPTINNCEYIIGSAAYNVENSRFEARTLGIPAKELGDAISFRAYFECEDGSYIYSRVIINYSPKTYCYNMINNDDTRDDALMVAILNYGASAQKYFKYDTDNLMNAKLSEEQKMLIWDDSLVRTDWTVPTVKEGELGRATSIISRGAYLSLLGAIDYNYYVKVEDSVAVAKAEILCWTESDYSKVDVLSIENASSAHTMEYTEDNKRYEFKYDGLAAKEMFSPIYACAMITDDNGTVYYSGVVAYCPERFAYINAANSSVTEAELAKRIVIYGDAARTFFSNY